MSKMQHYLVTNFQKSPSVGGFPFPAPLNLQFGDLKFRDLAKYWFLKLIMTKSIFKI